MGRGSGKVLSRVGLLGIALAAALFWILDHREAAAGPGLRPPPAPVAGEDPAEPAVQLSSPVSPVATKSMVRRGSIGGRVIDADSGSPMADASVRLFNPQWGPDVVVSSNADGAFLLDDLPVIASGWIRVSAPRHGSMNFSSLSLATGEHRDLGDVALPAGIALRGLVLAFGGGPIEGASVALVLCIDDPSRGLDGLLGLQAMAQEPEVIGKTTTDALGRFEFYVAGLGSWAVIAHAPGYERGTSHAVKIVRSSIEPVVLRLRPGTVLRGIVRDEFTAPIEGATIVASSGLRNPRPGSLPPGISARSRADGTFEVHGVRGPTAFVYVSAAGWPMAMIIHRNVEEPLDVTLRRGVSLSGTVYDAATAKPLPGARLWATSMQDWTSQHSVAMTGEDGRYRLEAPAGEDVQLTVSSTGYSIASPPRPATPLPNLSPHAVIFPSLAPGEERVLDVPMDRGGRLQGRVFDRRTGVLLAGAEIRIRPAHLPPDMIHFPEARSGRYGTFVLEPVPASTCSITVRAEGYLSGFARRPGAQHPSRIDVTAGSEVKDLEAALDRGTRIQGFVRTNSGDAVHGAAVTWSGESSSEIQFLTWDVVRSQPDGRFEILVPADGSITLAAEHEDHEERAELSVRADALPEAEVVLILRGP